uniref:Calcyclin-binding protein n=2 Tax=Bursaphelenchus xylophilus TaxID=6326 RepID=A0A1I7RTY9_BURXY
MSNQVELKADLSELEALRAQSLRPNVQKFLEKEILLANERLNKSVQAEARRAASTAAASSTGSAPRPLKKITTFAYDESDKFVKLYYTLNGIQNHPADRIESKIDEDSFLVRISDFNGFDYEFSARGLSYAIDASKSIVKPKTDLVLVMLKKQEEGKTWGKLLKLEKAAKIDLPDMEENPDPQASLMNMMKKMYDEGDDEMKRTIKKAMYESQQKKEAGFGLE